MADELHTRFAWAAFHPEKGISLASIEDTKDGAEIHIGLSRDPAGWQVREVVIRLHDRPSLDAAE